MARSFNTLPTSIFPRNDGLYYAVKQGKKEYSFGKTKACGPGGLNCACCNPHMGNIRNGKDKPKMRRYVRRVSKMNMAKELNNVFIDWEKEIEELNAEMDHYESEDVYDYYDPWCMYCKDAALREYEDECNYYAQDDYTAEYYEILEG